MTGLGPAELLSGGRAYFDALVERCHDRSELGWTVEEFLASILEVDFAQYRALVGLGGGDVPAQMSVTRPGRKRPNKVTWRELQARLKDGG